MTEIEYLWEHWKFNADQRLKAFNFFVVLSVFANGGAFTAIEKCVHPVVLAIIGIFIAVLAIVFWMLDARSRKLLHLSIEGIKAFEFAHVTPRARLFFLDDRNTRSVVRYTIAFRALFLTQLLLATLIVFYGIVASSSDWSKALEIPRLTTCKP